jgi:carboxymethylenebutenolidase
MKERLIDIATRNGKMDTFITYPEEGGPHPAVVLYMDVWGLREELFDVARRIATVGYYCLVPNFYYRQGRIRHQFKDANGRMISLHALDETRKQQVLAPLNKLTDQMVIDDTADLLAFLDRGEPVKKGAIGSIGYCMGGRHVFRAAEHFPDRFRAGASLHGTALVTDAPDSPHLGMKKARGEMYCGYAEKDPWTPPATIKAVADIFRGAEARYREVIHPGADHGYALPDRDIHDKQAANRDWEIIFAMFRRQLGTA